MAASHDSSLACYMGAGHGAVLACCNADLSKLGGCLRTTPILVAYAVLLELKA